MIASIFFIWSSSDLAKFEKKRPYASNARPPMGLAENQTVLPRASALTSHAAAQSHPSYRLGGEFRGSRFGHHAGGLSGRGNHIFGVSGDAVFVQVETITLALFADTQGTSGVHGQHHHHGDGESSQRDDGAADALCHQQRCSAAVEETGQRSGVIGSDRATRAILAGRKQAERHGAPDAAKAVDRNRADRIVNA